MTSFTKELMNTPETPAPIVSPFTRSWWLRLVVWQAAAFAMCLLLLGFTGTALHLLEHGFAQWSGDPGAIFIGVAFLLAFSLLYSALPLLGMALPYVGVFGVVGWACAVQPALCRSAWKLLLVSCLAALPGAVAVLFWGGQLTTAVVSQACGTLAIWVSRRVLFRRR